MALAHGDSPPTPVPGQRGALLRSIADAEAGRIEVRSCSTRSTTSREDQLHPDGWEDYTSWANERTILKRINRMIEEAARDPATGIGKPERLSHNLSGYWSRRITDEHRLVYQLRDEELIIVQARYHY